MEIEATIIGVRRGRVSKRQKCIPQPVLHAAISPSLNSGYPNSVRRLPGYYHNLSSVVWSCVILQPRQEIRRKDVSRRNLIETLTPRPRHTSEKVIRPLLLFWGQSADGSQTSCFSGCRPCAVLSVRYSRQLCAVAPGALRAVFGGHQLAYGNAGLSAFGGGLTCFWWWRTRRRLASRAWRPIFCSNEICRCMFSSGVREGVCM